MRSEENKANQERDETNKKAYNIRNAKNKPKYNKYSVDDDYEYTDKPAPKPDAPRRGRPSKRDEAERRDNFNPYEKPFYKKRKTETMIEGKEESHKSEVRGSEESASDKEQKMSESVKFLSGEVRKEGC